jgi:hypothetical protein
MEIKLIVREMLSAGMPESEILSNLNDLGVSEPKKILEEAKAAQPKKQQAPEATKKNAPQTPPAPSFAKEGLFEEDEGVKSPLLGPPEGEQSPQEGDAAGNLFPAQEQEMRETATSQSQEPFGAPTQEDTDKKIDELLALTKSLVDINKKILDSNRELLLKMAK